MTIDDMIKELKEFKTTLTEEQQKYPVWIDEDGVDHEMTLNLWVNKNTIEIW